MRKYALFYHHRRSNEIELFKDHLMPYLIFFSLRENKLLNSLTVAPLLSDMDCIALNEDEYETCMLETVRKNSHMFPSLMYYTYAHPFIYRYERSSCLRTYFLQALQNTDNPTEWLKHFIHKNTTRNERK